jgi:hypothetical protein
MTLLPNRYDKLEQWLCPANPVTSIKWLDHRDQELAIEHERGGE